jgi:ADP-ribose pyrophosphatase YjhB (NUDIX family)
LNQSLTNLPLPRRWQQQLHPVPSVVAVVSRNVDGITSYLLIRRKKEPYLGKWALVGGKWDFGESLSGAVCREVKEETGLSAVFSALHHVINCRLMPRAETDHGAHFLLFVCKVHAQAGEAREQAEGAVSWFTARELDALRTAQLIIPTDHMILERFGATMTPLAYTEAEIIVGRESTDVIDIVRFETIPLAAT